MAHRHRGFAVFVAIVVVLQALQLLEARVLFHFSLDLHLKKPLPEQIFADPPGNLTVELNSEEVPAPVTSAADLASTEATAADLSTRVLATRAAIYKLNQELSPVVGRSDAIAANVKLGTRYLNEAAAPAAGASTQSIVNVLQRFVSLVDKLQAASPSMAGGERSMEYLLMKLALEKHAIKRMQQQIRLEVLPAAALAEATWQRYNQTELVDVQAA